MFVPRTELETRLLFSNSGWEELAVSGCLQLLPCRQEVQGAAPAGGGWLAPGGLGARHTALVTYQVKDKNIQCLS